MVSAVGVPARKVPKRRYNVTFRPNEVELMDRVALRLGCSRSELLACSFGYWYDNVYLNGETYPLEEVRNGANLVSRA